MRLGQKSSFLDGVEQNDQSKQSEGTPQEKLYNRLVTYLAISDRRSGDQKILENLRKEILDISEGIISPDEPNPDSPYVIQTHKGTRRGKHTDVPLEEHHIFFSDGICLRLQQVDRTSTKFDHFRAWLSGSIDQLEGKILKAEKSLELSEEEFRRTFGYGSKRFDEAESKEILEKTPAELEHYNKVLSKLAELTSVEVDWRITPDSPTKRAKQAAARRIKRRK